MKDRFKRQLIINKHFAKEGQHHLVLILDGLVPDFNIGKLFRSAEVFSLRKICLINTAYFDPDPAKRTFEKLKATFYDQFDQCYQELKKDGYSFFAMDVHTENYLPHTKFPEKSAIILGHEERGLSFNPGNYPDINLVKIQQYGVTESLNVSIAGTIAVYEYLRQNVFD